MYGSEGGEGWQQGRDSPEVHGLDADGTIPHALSPALLLLLGGGSGGGGGALEAAAGCPPGGEAGGGGPVEYGAGGAEHGRGAGHRGGDGGFSSTEGISGLLDEMSAHVVCHVMGCIREIYDIYIIYIYTYLGRYPFLLTRDPVGTVLGS